ncbi:MAG: repeat containing protein [Herbinix sp.]|jgi:glucose/arabinose dehydrogenase|nr:repeat containing protein [Herbinix sp.]
MDYYDESNIKLRINNQIAEPGERYVNTNDITLEPGYRIEAFAEGLNFPINIVFTENGDMLIAESGYLTGNARILLLSNGQYETVAEGFNLPLTGVNYLRGNLYVSHRGFVTEIGPNGSRRDIITGLPSNGDFSNNKVEFGPDGKMYFGQGSVTNSGVVGTDNQWVHNFPLLNDYPGAYIMLNGQNFETNNMLLEQGISERALTGAFSPYGVPNIPFEIRKGVVKATGSILRANLNGTDLELFAWGLRNAIRLKFDEIGHLFAANQGYDERGSRPIANAPDEIYLVTQGLWYGWPDFSAGEPVTSTRFTPEGGRPLEFLLTNYPNIPPNPFTKFPPNATIMGFDINYDTQFGPEGDFYVAEFGSVWPSLNLITPNPSIGHRISKVNIYTGGNTTFAMNKSGFPASFTQEGGFGWLTDVVFGPDHAMYVVDYSTNPRGNLLDFLPNTGVIWRITKV